MFDALSNFAKATVSVALTPITVIVDVVKLPESSYNDRAPFEATGAMLKNAGDCVKAAVKPK